MTEKRIFLLSGRQGAGKSTYAKELVRVLPECISVKFADPLYALHDACLPILHALELRPADMKKDGELLQILGTEYGRKKLGENVWVDAVRRRVNKHLEAHSKGFVVIDDCRFPNELEAFHDAHKIRLVAPEEVRKARCSYWREDTKHPSETALDEYEEKKMFHCEIETSNADVPKVIHELLMHWGHLDRL